MPPIAGETWEEKSAKANKRAAEAYAKGSLLRVIACLKARPDVVPSIERTLIDRGVLTPREVAAVKTEGQEESTPQKREPRSSSHDELLAPAVPGDDASAQEKSSGKPCMQDPDVWDRNITTFGAAPVALQSLALQSAEPVTFSAANLKCVLRRGGRLPLD